MRLLHTEKLTFQEFIGDQIPQYAILSHRWGDAEVSYQDYRENKTTSGPGYSKILEFCKLAQSRGHEWAWIDTCCIDKTSSAELTESINSMWEWYRNSAECYVYLADVPDWVQMKPIEEESGDGESLGSDFRATWARLHNAEEKGDSERLDSKSLAAFQSSEWFSRGWTLQELIAPRRVRFCTTSWKILGAKSELALHLSRITGIGLPYVLSPEFIMEASIAMRMSWAAHRKTTRVEDIAYCMLGLFDVNMPLLYGEGMKAFMRLQRKLIKKYDDESIFAWRDNSIYFSGMLAISPEAFADSGSIIRLKYPAEQMLQYQVSNKGLELGVPSSLDPYHKGYWKSKIYSLSAPRFRHSILPLKTKYTKTLTKDPRGKDQKDIQLACEFSRSHFSVHRGDEPASRERKVIGITLIRVGGGWSRTNCGRFETWPDFVEKDGSSRSVYYVHQSGL
jgi:hypothetical protein